MGRQIPNIKDLALLSVVTGIVSPRLKIQDVRVHLPIPRC